MWLLGVGGDEEVITGNGYSRPSQLKSQAGPSKKQAQHHQVSCESSVKVATSPARAKQKQEELSPSTVLATVQSSLTAASARSAAAVTARSSLFHEDCFPVWTLSSDRRYAERMRHLEQMNSIRPLRARRVDPAIFAVKPRVINDAQGNITHHTEHPAHWALNCWGSRSLEPPNAGRALLAEVPRRASSASPSPGIPRQQLARPPSARPNPGRLSRRRSDSASKPLRDTSLATSARSPPPVVTVYAMPATAKARQADTDATRPELKSLGMAESSDPTPFGARSDSPVRSRRAPIPTPASQLPVQDPEAAKEYQQLVMEELDLVQKLKAVEAARRAKLLTKSSLSGFPAGDDGTETSQAGALRDELEHVRTKIALGEARRNLYVTPREDGHGALLEEGAAAYFDAISLAVRVGAMSPHPQRFIGCCCGSPDATCRQAPASSGMSLQGRRAPHPPQSPETPFRTPPRWARPREVLSEFDSPINRTMGSMVNACSSSGPDRPPEASRANKAMVPSQRSQRKTKQRNSITSIYAVQQSQRSQRSHRQISAPVTSNRTQKATPSMEHATEPIHVSPPRNPGQSSSKGA